MADEISLSKSYSMEANLPTEEASVVAKAPSNDDKGKANAPTVEAKVEDNVSSEENKEATVPLEKGNVESKEASDEDKVAGIVKDLIELQKSAAEDKMVEVQTTAPAQPTVKAESSPEGIELVSDVKESVVKIEISDISSDPTLTTQIMTENITESKPSDKQDADPNVDNLPMKEVADKDSEVKSSKADQSHNDKSAKPDIPHKSVDMKFLADNFPNIRLCVTEDANANLQAGYATEQAGGNAATGSTPGFYEYNFVNQNVGPQVGQGPERINIRIPQGSLPPGGELNVVIHPFDESIVKSEINDSDSD